MSGIKTKRVRIMRRFEHFDLIEEEWDPEERGGPTLRMESYRNKAGDYIDSRHLGNRPALVRMFAKHGIAPELATPGNNVCSVGRAADGRWFGWSHRAACAFGPGDKVYEGGFDCDDTTPFRQHGSRDVVTDADAREAAVNFADSVS